MCTALLPFVCACLGANCSGLLPTPAHAFGHLAPIKAKYGHIRLWCTLNVASMAELFMGQTVFDDKMSGWQTQAVTSIFVQLR